MLTKRGTTVLELLIVVVIIAILAMIMTNNAQSVLTDVTGGE